MNGRTAAIVIVVAGVLMAVGVWYAQVYGYYDRLDTAEIRMTPINDAPAELIEMSDFQGIDANSSPLRFRGCFKVKQTIAELSSRYKPMAKPTPLNGPGWFDCYDARTVGEALEAGEATAFLGERNIADGVDRVIAVFPDGRAFAWHQLNEKYQD